MWVAALFPAKAFDQPHQWLCPRWWWCNAGSLTMVDGRHFDPSQALACLAPFSGAWEDSTLCAKHSVLGFEQVLCNLLSLATVFAKHVHCSPRVLEFVWGRRR